MGKWSDRLKLMNASTGLPAEPAEGASAGYGGVLGGASWASETPEGRSEPIEQLSLSRYATSGECRKVHSKVGESVILSQLVAPFDQQHTFLMVVLWNTLRYQNQSLLEELLVGPWADYVQVNHLLPRAILENRED